jgi:hypothetical protein
LQASENSLIDFCETWLRNNAKVIKKEHAPDWLDLGSKAPCQHAGSEEEKSSQGPALRAQATRRLQKEVG